MNELATTVSNIDLNFTLGKFNIINCGIRTGKTYWAINNLQKFTRDGNLNRVLFLTDTTVLKENLQAEYGGRCCDADDMWWSRSKWGERSPNKIGVACYQNFVRRLLKCHSKFDFLKDIDCICWDECDSIFDFAVNEFAKARRTKFAREDKTNQQILNVIQDYSTDSDYMALILLGEWEKIVKEGRILCIGMSGSPERSVDYYGGICAAANEGKLQSFLQIGEELHYTNIYKYLEGKKPDPNKIMWIYSPYIESNYKLANYLRAGGYSPLVLFSKNNKDYQMNEEQLAADKMLTNAGMIMNGYNCVIVTKSYQRGITIRDSRVTDVIVDALDKESRIQTPRNIHPYQLHLKVHSLEVPKQYLRKWLTLEECRELAEAFEVTDSKTTSPRKMTWNKLKEYLPKIGYTVTSQRKRINGKQPLCYFIDGEFKDYYEENTEFMQLVTARMEAENNDGHDLS